jgi:hypothetical protein
MAFPRARAGNRNGKRAPGSGYDATRAGGNKDAEHNYESDGGYKSRGSGSLGGDRMGYDRGSRGRYGDSAGELNYDRHGTPGPAARRYVGMPEGMYNSRKTPDSNVRTSVYREGDPPPKGFQQSAVRGADNGRIGRSKASSTY